MDKFSLARLIGHSSPKITERYYIHVSEPDIAVGFEKFETYRAQQEIAVFSKKGREFAMKNVTAL
jgi:hypothetical protein